MEKKTGRELKEMIEKDVDELYEKYKQFFETKDDCRKAVLIALRKLREMEEFK